MRGEFDLYMKKIASDIGDRPLDEDLEHFLNEHYGTDTKAFNDLEALCHKAVKEGWMCDREAGGIKFGRVAKPGEETHGFSVDVVSMSDIRGPHHIHTTGEIGMIMPISKQAKFDGKGRGWYVYPPGSAHYPTVSGGDALVLYLLPDGQIEFTGR